jgi:hypothetical protein
MADYSVIAISPALIMALVGSLLFFLVEVFYQDQYQLRLQFILAMFVMASVLIARISIEESREYAALFALPLGIVTMIALMRFVQFGGFWAPLSPVINLALLGLTWWAADRLTWDCTVLDESKDASGEGLLQTAGLDADSTAAHEDAIPTELDADATTARESTSRSLWQRFVEARHRPHAHGVWVIYFSLVALPIFGLGQFAISGAEVSSRRYVFNLLVIYLASALGLLLTTSFLGLRRYMRQRRLEMPTDMAGVWLGLGAVLIVVLLLLCTVLPRRNAEYSVSDLPFLARSPDNLSTSDWGVGNDGPQKEDADRTGQQSGQPASSQQDRQQKSSGGDQGQPSESSGADDAKGGNSTDQDSGQSPGRGQGQSKGSQSKGSQTKQGQNQSRSQGSRQQSQRDRSSQPQSGEPSRSETSRSPEEASSDRGDTSTKDQSGSRSNQDSNQRESSSGSKSEPSSRNGQSGTKNDRPGESANERSESAKRDQQPESQNSEAKSSGSRSSSRFNPSRLMGMLGSGFAGLLKLLYWLAVLLIVGCLLIRYRREILTALSNFVRALQEFWERLFGARKSEVVEQAIDEAERAAPTGRPFADFPDPFATGAADRWSTDQLVRYSFEAFEAWARERGCPRAPEQTPYEFAKAMSLRERGLGRSALNLAELFNVSAYAGRSVGTPSVASLRQLWAALRP